MAYWLLKTEPDDYSFDDLLRDKKTVWDGVANNTALKHIRSMTKGDQAIIYHTGDERSAIGLAEIISQPYADPLQDDEKLAVVDVKAGAKLDHPVSLGVIKQDPAFADWDLLRIGRLSVVPTPAAIWHHLIKLSRSSTKG